MLQQTSPSGARIWFIVYGFGVSVLGLVLVFEIGLWTKKFKAIKGANSEHQIAAAKPTWYGNIGLFCKLSEIDLKIFTNALVGSRHYQ